MSICILWQEETDVKGATNANSTRLIYLGWKSNLRTSCLLFLPFKNRQKSLIRLKRGSQRKPSLQIQCSPLSGIGGNWMLSDGSQRRISSTREDNSNIIIPWWKSNLRWSHWQCQMRSHSATEASVAESFHIVSLL